MKARLIYPDADFDWKWAQRAVAERTAGRTGYRSHRPPDFDPRAGLPPNAEDLERDLDLAPLLSAMARDDDWIHEVSRRVLLEGVRGDLEVIRYRQAILQDCLEHPEVARRLYALTVEAAERIRGHYVGVLSRYPDWVLRDALETLGKLLPPLRELREIAEEHGPHFRAEGWIRCFTTIRENLNAAYLGEVEHHLRQLKFPHGVLLSAELGAANKGIRYQSTAERCGTGGGACSLRSPPSTGSSSPPGTRPERGPFRSSGTWPSPPPRMHWGEPPTTCATSSPCFGRSSPSTSAVSTSTKRSPAGAMPSACPNPLQTLRGGCPSGACTMRRSS